MTGRSQKLIDTRGEEWRKNHRSHDDLMWTAPERSVRAPPGFYRDPDAWVGQPYPLWHATETSKECQSGDWLLIFHDPDCSHCQQVIPKLADTVSDGLSKHRLALIDTTGSAVVESIDTVNAPIHGRMDPRKKWLVTPPVGLLLHDGVVQVVIWDDELLELLDR